MALRTPTSSKVKQPTKMNTTVGGSSLKTSRKLSWKFAAPLIAIITIRAE